MYNKKKYVKEQYKSDSNLEKRSQIHRYNTNKIPWNRWIFEHLNLKANMDVLEIGCGNGTFWLSNSYQLPHITVTLSDTPQRDAAGCRL